MKCENTCIKCEYWDGQEECPLSKCILCEPELKYEITGNEIEGGGN